MTMFQVTVNPPPFGDEMHTIEEMVAAEGMALEDGDLLFYNLNPDNYARVVQQVFAAGVWLQARRLHPDAEKTLNRIDEELTTSGALRRPRRRDRSTDE